MFGPQPTGPAPVRRNHLKDFSPRNSSSLMLPSLTPHRILLLFFLLPLSVSLIAQPEEDEYYKIITLPTPEGSMLEVGGLVTLPNGSLAASTRRGDVWIIGNPYMLAGALPKYRKFASGLHEILGLAYHKGALYCAQRTELTKLEDTDGDGRADVYETVQSWPVSGNYHGYAFGPKISAEGKMYITLNVHFDGQEWWRGQSRVPWRGWTMEIDPEAGTIEPYAAGMRSPCGIGIIDGQFFYADNQGDWMGSGGLVHLEKGDFAGHPASLNWAEHPDSPVDMAINDVYYRVNPRLSRPGEPFIKPENIEDEAPYSLANLAEDIPAVKTPAVWLPHTILGISTSEIIVDETEGQFGPFAGQVFIGDQGQSKIMRVNLEQVDGVYQGAAFNFRKGFQSGILRMSWGQDGTLFVGETNRGWGSAGTEAYGLERLAWTGKTPFEMHSILAENDGFTVKFTLPVDKVTASKPENYSITGFTYKYHPVYGSPLVDQVNHEIEYVAVAADGMSARLKVKGLREKYIHEVKASGVQSYDGNLPLLHETGYYTLNKIPQGDTLSIPKAWREARAAAEQAAMEKARLEARIAALEAAQAQVPANAQKAKAHDHSAMAKPEPRRVQAKAVTSPDNPASQGPKSGSKNPTRMPGSWGGKADATVTLSTIPGMKYDRGTITVSAGSKIKFTFFNNDDMPHNIVFVKPGTMSTVGRAAGNLGLDGPAMEYVPDLSAVMFHSTLLGPGSKQTLYFTAPDKPGTYAYVCTFPGHWRTMNGKLVVR
jgi:azurin